ncbi:MAG: LysR family transcriptional regulator [Deltaproteobacteria bacterium]|nr:LysR family transcriptional regulator [Deltaproteobacteria bacterium]
MEIKHKIWLEKDGKVFFGSGRGALFKAILKHHSINAALKKEAGMDMSYRAAWGRLKASQERLGIQLVSSENKRIGTELTKEGEALMMFFEKLDAKVEALLSDATQELLAVFDESKKRG